MLQAPPIVLLFVFSIFILVILNFLKRKTQSINAVLFLILFHITLVVSITLFPIPIQKNLLSDLRSTNSVSVHNFIPLKSIIELLTNSVSPTVYLKQIVGNIIMCVPFGFLWPILIKRITLKRMLVLAISIGFGIEATQYIINTAIDYDYRSIDIDDVLLNFIGVLLGYCLLLLLNKKSKKTLTTIPSKRADRM
ncbi:VanZ family protein [Paenibacillus xylaniclasticus]|jgi:Glycopeptide antibiotics resistance protein|uniref:VanZ family protein n=1 Tax=Paenibacillus xylaniclasticus TaxID=588083 RepID=UPI000FDA514A|nr:MULTISPECIES: VanZ family protein [Paenibacillus]GFN33213.1 antibiotic resistance protein VanZ [Paenibacillus curdlanolyticus]